MGHSLSGPGVFNGDCPAPGQAVLANTDVTDESWMRRPQAMFVKFLG